jgi:hypothetical protein
MSTFEPLKKGPAGVKTTCDACENPESDYSEGHFVTFWVSFVCLYLKVSLIT